MTVVEHSSEEDDDESEEQMQMEVDKANTNLDNMITKMGKQVLLPIIFYIDGDNF